MKTKELKASGLNKKYSVIIENEEFEAKVDAKINQLAKKYQTSGF